MKRITIALAAACALLSFGAIAGEEAPAKEAAPADAKPAKTTAKKVKKAVKDTAKAVEKETAKDGAEKPAEGAK